MPSGITYNQLPQDFTPAFNMQIIGASSTNVGQPNFKYTIKVTDVITSDVKVYQRSPLPNTTLVFYAQTAARSFIKNYIPINSYGWKVCTDAIRQIKVNVGETYDIAGVSTYTAGTDKTYIIWNGVRDFLEFQSYNYTDFVTDPSVPRLKYLSDLLPEKTYADRSNLFYKLRKGTNSSAFKITTYNAAGSYIADSYLNEPAGATYADRYLCIDLGVKGLSGVAGVDDGAYPIITASVAYYDVYDVVITGYGGGGAPIYGTATYLKRYYINCSPRYDIITLHCLMKNGNYRAIHCPLNSVRASTNTKSTFKKLPYVENGAGVTSYSYDAAVEQVLNVFVQDSLKVNTDWLTEAESALYKQAVESTSILMDLGSGQGYASVLCKDISYTTKKYYNEKLFQLSFNIQYTHDNHRQMA